MIEVGGHAHLVACLWCLGEPYQEIEIYVSYPSDKVEVFYKKIGSDTLIAVPNNSGMSGSPDVAPIILGDMDTIHGHGGMASAGLLIKAIAPSDGWDDVKIKMEAINNANPPGKGEIELTAYRITKEIREKPWGGTWGNPEDNDTYQVDGKLRNWYHLWSVNENAIRAVVEPQCIGDIVLDSHFGQPVHPGHPIHGGIAVDFACYQDNKCTNGVGCAICPDPTAKPMWKRLTGGGAPTVFATVVAEHDQKLTSTQTNVDVVVNAVSSVTWLLQGISATVQDDQLGTLHLAELGTLDSQYHFAGVPGSPPVFPTFGLTAGVDQFTQARIAVGLARAIPKDMEATVHLKWFDPPNKVNQAGLTLSDQTLTFTNADSPNANAPPTKRVLATFQEGLGDNFIVAAHPNTGIVDTYWFACDETLMRPVIQGDTSNVHVPAPLRTATLHNAAWKGFKVPIGWGFDEGNYSIETEALKTVEALGRGASYAKSVLTKRNLGKNMKLTLGYYFDRSRDNVGTPWGYVWASRFAPPNPPRAQLSFVGNSGVKIGGSGGHAGGTGPCEIQIIDVEALVALGILDIANGSIDNFRPDRQVMDAGVQDNRMVARMTAIVQYAGSPTQLNFAQEPLNWIMHGVAYGGDYNDMADYTNTSSTPPWLDYWNALRNNFLATQGNNFTMEIDWTPQPGQLTTKVNGGVRYSGILWPHQFGGDFHLYLQSHWGSGVVFTSASFLPDTD